MGYYFAKTKPKKQPVNFRNLPFFRRAKMKQEKAVVPVSRHNCRGHRPAVPFGASAVNRKLVLFWCQNSLITR